MSSSDSSNVDTAEGREQETKLSYWQVFRLWWPLAFSWLLIAIDLPLANLVVARMDEPEINLAAFGSLVFPLTLLIESPIFMLTAAATVLVRNKESYARLARFSHTLSLLLCLIQFSVVVSPAYYFLCDTLLNADPRVSAAARPAMGFFSIVIWIVGYRRFLQGVLIREGFSRYIGLSTVYRLMASSSSLFIGYYFSLTSGVILASVAICIGVVVELFYVRHYTLRYAKPLLVAAKSKNEIPSVRDILDYYVPLALTSMLTLLANPIATAAMFRMPQPLYSVSAWPVVSGFFFVFQSFGIAYREVVLAYSEECDAGRVLRNSAGILAISVSCILVLFFAAGGNYIWFIQIAGLSDDLGLFALAAAWCGILYPTLAVYRSWYYGGILVSGQTKLVTYSIVVFLVVQLTLLVLGILFQIIPGLPFVLIATSCATGAQLYWMRRKLVEIKAVSDCFPESLK